MPKLGVESKVKFINDPHGTYLPFIGEFADTAKSVSSAVPPSRITLK